MPVKVTVKRKVIHNAVKGISVGTEDGLEKVILALKAQVKANAPVDKGILRGSIFSKLKKLSGFVKTNNEYAIYQEEGTKNMRAANGGKGFFKPAIDYIKVRMGAIMSSEIRKAIRRN